MFWKHYNKIKKYLPTRENFYNFLFNSILLIITLYFGNYYINVELIKINQQKIEQQNLLDKRNEFIKEFAETGQKRIYLAENYFWNTKNKESKEILSRSWENYMNAISEWNNKNLLNPIFIKYYFGEDSQNEFYNDLLPKFIELHESLLNLRDGNNGEDIENLIEEAKHELFVFSEKIISLK